MTDNGIRIEGAKSMSEMLKKNTALTSLHLESGEGRMKRKTKEIMND